MCHRKLLAYTEPLQNSVIIPLDLSLGVSPGNPIIDLFIMESEFYNQRDLLRAQQKIAMLMAEFYKIFREGKAFIDTGLTEKLLQAYRIMARHFEFGSIEESWDSSLLTRHLLAGKLDCDTQIFLIMSLAYEMRWDQVGWIRLPGHVLIQADNTYLDFGRIFSRQHYVELFELPADKNIQARYFSPIDLRSVMFFNRGNVWHNLGDGPQAISDFSRAIALNWNYEIAFYNRAEAKTRMGDLAGALLDYQQALDRYPNDDEARKKIEQIKGQLARENSSRRSGRWGFW